jgi:transposase
MTKHTFLTLTAEQRQQLESVVRTGQHPARKQTRARVLLLLDRSQDKTRTDNEIAQTLGCHSNTVGNIRRRFLAEGLEATLADKPMGPTAPRKMTGEIEAHLTLLACSDAPEGYSRWTHRLLADKAVELGYVESLSHVTVGTTLKKTKSSPGVSRDGASASPRRNT